MTHVPSMPLEELPSLMQDETFDPSTLLMSTEDMEVEWDGHCLYKSLMRRLRHVCKSKNITRTSVSDAYEDFFKTLTPEERHAMKTHLGYEMYLRMKRPDSGPDECQ